MSNLFESEELIDETMEWGTEQMDKPVDTQLGPGANWLAKQGVKLSPLGQKVADLLADLYRGIYHIQSQALKVDWQHTQLIEIVLRDDNFSTYDSDGLTRLVFLCHERDLRVSIRGAANRYLRLQFVEVTKNGFFHEGHPTLEEAITNWEKSQKRSK